MARFVPTLSLALLAAWCGTLQGGATAAGSTAALVALLAVLLGMGAPWRDPLQLGRTGRLIPIALWIAAAVSWWASPVRRAGTTGLLLLPAFLLLPGAFARCWREEAARRQGLRALAGAVGGVALWALGDAVLLGAPRAAMPLGHHILLAAWLVTLLPLAVLPSREQGAWRFLGLAAGAATVAAVLASRSFLGAAALGVEAVLGLALTWDSRRAKPSPPALIRVNLEVGEGLAPSRVGGGCEGENGTFPPSREGASPSPTSKLTLRRIWIPGLLALAALAALLQGPRLVDLLRGRDVSARARLVYYAAGWRGFMARPLVGWGPGSTAWTNARFLAPEPGVNPPGEAVGELHSMPLEVAYELGGTGLVLSMGLVGLFFVRRAGELRGAGDRGLLVASLLGLAGAAVAALGTANVAVAALPWAVAAAAGGALAAMPGEKQRRGAWPVRLYAVVLALALAPAMVAHWWYDRALAAELNGRRQDALRELERAVLLDPGFPLYRMRLGLLRNDPALALRAAEDGHDVAALWTVAGILGEAGQRPWAAAALDRACADGPFDPFPPFFAMQSEPLAGSAPRCGGRALLAAPKLAAAVVWEGREGLYAEALRQVRSWEGVDPGWKEAFLAAAAISPADRQGEPSWLALTFDTDPRESISVALFRRRPWPTQWPLVPVRGGLLDRFGLPPATTLATTSPAALPPVPCVTTPPPDRHRAVTGQPLRSR